MLVSDIECKPFATFETFQDPSYSDVLGNLPSETLDDRFNQLYANRTVFAAVVYDGKLIESALLGIWLTYADKWKAYRKDLGLEYDPLNPYDSTTTRNRTYSTKGSSSNKESGTESVYGFDSETPVNDNATGTDSNSSNQRDDTTTESVNIKGRRSSTTPADLIRRDLRLRQTRLVDTILSDVRGELTLSIYE